MSRLSRLFGRTPDAPLIAPMRLDDLAATGLRVWVEGDPEPTDVRRVRDHEGDVWVQRPTGLWRIEANVRASGSEMDWRGRLLGASWRELLANYGPLVEAPNGGVS